MSYDYFDSYFSYVGVTESPTIFHRWTAISIVGALLGRQVYLPFGHGRVYPNQYILLTGGPGTRKGTAIKIGTHLLKQSLIDYKWFAPNKCQKETLWHKMANQHLSDDEDLQDLVFEPESTEMYIAQDEFIDFIGIGNDELITNLTNMWDNLDKFDYPKMTKQDTEIFNPTINILSGATPGGISEAFGQIAMTGGFFSRLLFIYGGSTSKKIAWPDPPDAEIKEEVVRQLFSIKQLQGEVIMTPVVRKLLSDIYKNTPSIPDKRFAYYYQRRFTHLLKLVIIIAATRHTIKVSETDVILANTLLHLAELQMPSALGEFGKARNSSVANQVLDMLNHTDEPLNIGTIWKSVSQDLNKLSELADILNSLLQAEKVQKVTLHDKTGYLPVNLKDHTWDSKYINYALVKGDEHPEEMTHEQKTDLIY